MDGDASYYGVLNVPPTASEGEIRKAYRHLAQVCSFLLPCVESVHGYIWCSGGRCTAVMTVFLRLLMQACLAPVSFDLLLNFAVAELHQYWRKARGSDLGAAGIVCRCGWARWTVGFREEDDCGTKHNIT